MKKEDLAESSVFCYLSDSVPPVLCSELELVYGCVDYTDPELYGGDGLPNFRPLVH